MRARTQDSARAVKMHAYMAAYDRVKVSMPLSVKYAANEAGLMLSRSRLSLGHQLMANPRMRLITTAHHVAGTLYSQVSVKGGSNQYVSSHHPSTTMLTMRNMPLLSH